MKGVTDSSLKYTSEDFWKTLEAILLKQYSHTVAQSIISEFEKVIFTFSYTFKDYF